MNIESYRELKVLEEISSHPNPTQRHLAKELGVALGLTNLMVRRCVKKGYLKIASLQKNRIRYLITPKGIMEKTRLTYEYLEYSLFLYHGTRQVLRENLNAVAHQGGKNVVFFGTGEIAEIAYLTLKECGLNLVGVIDERAVGGNFLGVPIMSFQELSTLSYDCGIVGSLNDGMDGLQEHLQKARVPSEKILVIKQKGADIRAVIPGFSNER